MVHPQHNEVNLATFGEEASFPDNFTNIDPMGKLGHLNIPRLVEDIDRMQTPHGENGMTSGPIKLRFEGK